MYQTSPATILADPFPVIDFADDITCLAAALRSACLAAHTLPHDAIVVTLDEPEPTWLVAAALTGVTLVRVEAVIEERPVVALLADACARPAAALDELRAALRSMSVTMVIDAPAAIFDDEAIAILAGDANTLVVVSDDTTRHVWRPRLAGTLGLLHSATRRSVDTAFIAAVA